MITKYDISTKDKDVSYIEFVDMILDRLGFRRNNVGTRFLREFVIYLYKKNPLAAKAVAENANKSVKTITIETIRLKIFFIVNRPFLLKNIFLFFH